MIGKIIEGRYVGSEVHKHPERNVLYIQTQEGQKVALSKNNIISMDDVSSQYPSVGSKTMMVIWNDFEISILQFGNVTNNAVKEHVQKKDMHTPEDNSSTYKSTEKDHRNREAWKEFERQRKTKKNGKTHGFIFLGTILIVAICFAFAIATRETVAKTPVDAMGACLEIMALPESELTDKKMALFYDNLELLGIDSYSKNDLSIDEVEAIVAEYTFPEFYQFICDLSQFYNAHNRYLGYEDYESIVKQYLRVSDVKTYTVAELDLIESDDFYKQYPSAKPQPETTTVSGKFFEDGDDKVETETRENTSTVTYIGDFAIEKVSGYNYDEGVYEWRNGEFIDEPASWKKFEKEYLWYKGEPITSLEEPITIIKYDVDIYVVGNYAGFEKIDVKIQNAEQTELVVQPETTPPPTLEELAYAEGEHLENQCNYGGAAIAYAHASGYRDADERSKMLWDRIAKRSTISGCPNYMFALTTDGVLATSISCVGEYGLAEINDAIKDTDIIAISSGGDYKVALKSDGTVLVANQYRMVSVDWTDIVAVSAGSYHIAGLRSDGTVVIFREESEELKEWSNIVAVSAGHYYTVGLKSDGTVVSDDSWNAHPRANVGSWSDIVAISAGVIHTVGLRSDGTVVAIGENNYNECDVSGWSDIIDVAVGTHHTIGLKSDGTVVAVGLNDYNQCNVSTWNNIVDIYADDRITMGLRSDGTVVAVGRNDNQHQKWNVSDWRNIMLP